MSAADINTAPPGRLVRLARWLRRDLRASLSLGFLLTLLPEARARCRVSK